ncbi:DCN1-like protein 2 isoform X4 [Agelaius tricolor]|uniref:DCN1-like protein 2 isoform X4 n=1 Tax=Agelaius tricolor TaxID=9191 RepID=UPI0039F17A71
MRSHLSASAAPGPLPAAGRGKRGEQKEISGAQGRPAQLPLLHGGRGTGEKSRLPRPALRQRRSPEGRKKARSGGAGRAGSPGGGHGYQWAAAAGGGHRGAPSLRPPLAPRRCSSAGAAPRRAAGRDPHSERRLAAGNVTVASRRTPGVVVGAAAPQLPQRRSRRRSPGSAAGSAPRSRAPPLRPVPGALPGGRRRGRAGARLRGRRRRAVKLVGAPVIKC